MDVNTILTSLYYISGIILAVTAIYGLTQIRLFKKDLTFRIERTAKEKAIEASRIYLTEFVELSNNDYKIRLSKNDASLKTYKGPIGDFTNASIPKELLDTANKRISVISCLPVINCLESISAFFTTGVADEKIGFKIIGRSFCANVELEYDIISLHRSSKALGLSFIQI